MTKKVQFVTGLSSGLVMPALTWLIFDVLYKNIWVLSKPAIPYLVSIAINLLLLRYLIRNGKEAAGYGVIISTFIVFILIFKLKGNI